MDEVLVPAAILFLAGAVQGVSGFGFGMVAMSLLPLVMGVREAVPLVAPPSFLR